MEIKNKKTLIYLFAIVFVFGINFVFKSEAAAGEWSTITSCAVREGLSRQDLNKILADISSKKDTKSQHVAVLKIMDCFIDTPLNPEGFTEPGGAYDRTLLVDSFTTEYVNFMDTDKIYSACEREYGVCHERGRQAIASECYTIDDPDLHTAVTKRSACYSRIAREIETPCILAVDRKCYKKFKDLIETKIANIKDAGPEEAAAATTCKNGKLDKGEENIDCGGVCPACSYKIQISPSTKLTMTANGRQLQEFTITATLYNKPASGLSYDLSLRQTGDIFDSLGKLSAKKITTDANGRASFTYTAPLPPEKLFANVRVDITLSGPSGKQIFITMKDPRPRVSVKLDERSMLQGVEMNYGDVTIKDDDNKKWDIKIDASLGTLIPVGTGESAGNEVYTINASVDKPEYHFNWNPPASLVKLIDSYSEYAKAHKTDWNNFKTAVIEETVQKAIERAGKYAGKNPWAVSQGGKDVEATTEFGLEVKSYYDQIKSWAGTAEQMKQDMEEIRNSQSFFEGFLRSLSIGVEGLQATYGTKTFYDEKTGGKKFTFVEKIRDKTIDYGCDSLQSGLRLWANLEREANTNTWRLPVHIIVKVTDEDGYSTKKDIVFQYTYYYGSEK